MTRAIERDTVSVIPETTVISVDNELRNRVVWRDLTPMRAIDGVVECLHPLPWLVATGACVTQALWLPAAGAAFMFFLTALRLNHEAIHGNLGLSPRGHRLVIHVLSALMLGSNSAVAANHLHHHRHVGRPDDLEGKAGTMSGWRVLLYGPVFPIEMHRAAWASSNPVLRRRMVIDLLLNMLVVDATLSTGSPILMFHVALMIVAQCLTAFFAVWITHHDCPDGGPIARTQRSRIVNLLTYNMFFHLEHHLFPGVPVKRLRRLAERIDHAAPALTAGAARVLPNPLG